MKYRVASAQPLNKVLAGALAGALTAIIAWALARFAGIVLPDEVRQALVVLISFGVAYVVPIADGEITPQ